MIIRDKESGQISWDADDFVTYEVTGVDVYGKRFKMRSDNWHHVRMINLYRGTRWGVKSDGRRVKLQKVYS